MTTSKTKYKSGAKAEPKQTNPNALEVNVKPGEEADTLARTVIAPSVTGGIAMHAFIKKSHSEMALMPLIKATSDQIKKVQSGDLRRVESLLVAQAHTLDTIFNELARRAASNMGEHLKAMETYMRVALKAQSQCRATLETLIEIKNPQPTAFIKQQNIGVNQQVNNEVTPHAHGKIINQPNELLTESNYAALDTRRTGATIGTDSQLETVATIDRTIDDRRQSS